MIAHPVVNSLNTWLFGLGGDLFRCCSVYAGVSFYPAPPTPGEGGGFGGGFPFGASEDQRNSPHLGANFGRKSPIKFSHTKILT